jgi:hypothetical protein
MTFPQQVLGKQDVPDFRDEKKPGWAGLGDKGLSPWVYLDKTVSLKSGQVSWIRSTKSAAKID